MASTAVAARLTEAHRLAQARLGAATVQQLLDVWTILDVGAIDATAPRWLRVASTVVEARFRHSTKITADYLRAYRALELGTLSGFEPVLAVFDQTRVSTSLSVTGPISLKSAMARGVDIVHAADTAKARSAAAGMRQALTGGRDSLTATVAADPRALGYARVTSGKACEFCSSLAARGAVYSDDTVHFDAHDGCSCSGEPVYG